MWTSSRVLILLLYILFSSCSKFEHIFTSFYFENDQLFTVGKQVNISLNSKFNSIVNDVCSNYPFWYSADCAMCVNNIYYHAISNLTATELQLHFAERLDVTNIFNAMYYDFLLPTRRTKPTVCVFGNFSMHMLYSLLTLNRDTSIVYFVDSVNSENRDEIKKLLELFSGRIDLINSPMDEFIDNINLIRRHKLRMNLNRLEEDRLPVDNVCDIVHIRGEDVSPSSVLLSLSSIVANTVADLPVIWERNDFNAHFELYPEVDWVVRGPWYGGEFSVTDNSNTLRCGLAKLYAINPPLVDIWMGYSHKIDTANVIENTCAGRDESGIHFVLTYTDFIFLETALGLRDALQLSGIDFDHIHVTGLLNMSVIGDIRELKGIPFQIAIGPHHPTLLLKHYAIFHTENVLCDFLYLGSYHHVLQNAMKIFIYAPFHKSFIMQQFGISEDKIFIIPFYSHSPYLEDSLVWGPDDAYLHKDVYFYGTPSKRRNTFADELSTFCLSRNISLLTSLMLEYRYPYDTRIKEWYINHARIIVNIHSTEGDIVLETHRLNHLLSLGKIIITEPSVDFELDSQYSDAVVFAELDEINTLIEMLLSNEDLMLKMESRAKEKYKEISHNVSSFSLAVKQIVFELSMC